MHAGMDLQKASKRNQITDEQIEEICRQVQTAKSLREITRNLGSSRETIKRHAGPIIEAMREAGTLGNCECGLPRFHPRICSKTAHNGVGRTWPEQIQWRRKIVAEIITGAPLTRIADRYGVTPHSLRRYLRYLTPAQREQRKAMPIARCGPERLDKRATIVAQILRGDTFSKIGERWGISAKAAARYRRWLTPEQLGRRKAREQTYAVVVRPHSDPLYARISAAVPRWLSEATRDDAISDLYLAVMEGSVAVGDVVVEARRYATKAVSQWESRFGPRSLDEAAFEDSRDTLGARIADPESLIPFEDREVEEA